MLKKPGAGENSGRDGLKRGSRSPGAGQHWLWAAALFGVVAVAVAVFRFALPGPGVASVAPQETVSSQGGATPMAPPLTVTQSATPEQALPNQGTVDRAIPPAAIIQSATLEQAPSNQGAVERPSPSPAITQQELLGALIRYGARPEGSSSAFFPAVDVLLVTPVYVSLTGRQAPGSAQNGPSIIFYVAENMHMGELPESPPQTLLKVGDFFHSPVETTMLSNSPHHRTTLVRYAFQGADGDPVVKAGDRSLELLFPTAAGETPSGSVLSWGLPIAYGDGYSSDEIAIGVP
ncbi:MAG: hypothetical protein HY671_09400 [Chloroflexi bacterium]|nr:hypothetical protein [Chloroflexota bacterium]